MVFFLNLEAKSIDFVLSSPKLILSLLSTNQSHILEKSTFSCFSIWLISLCWQTRHESLANRKRWNLAACDMSLTYIKNKSGPIIEPWVTPQDIDAGLEKLFSKLTRKDLLEREHINQLKVCFEKAIVYNFCNSTFCQRLFEDQLESCHSPYPYQSL